MHTNVCVCENMCIKIYVSMYTYVYIYIGTYKRKRRAHTHTHKLAGVINCDSCFLGLI